jgi:hypothetical protein
MGARVGLRQGVARRWQSETCSGSPFIQNFDVGAKVDLRFETHLEEREIGRERGLNMWSVRVAIMVSVSASAWL